MNRAELLCRPDQSTATTCNGFEPGLGGRVGVRGARLVDFQPSEGQGPVDGEIGSSRAAQQDSRNDEDNEQYGTGVQEAGQASNGIPDARNRNKRQGDERDDHADRKADSEPESDPEQPDQ